MKYSILVVLFALSFHFNASAKILIVDNNIKRPTGSGANVIYTTFSDAYTAANAYDTLYLQGSGTAYTCVNLDKQLYIIGVGFSPSVGNASTLNVSGYYVNVGVVMIGLNLTGGIYMRNPNGMIGGTKFIRCSFNVPMSNNVSGSSNTTNLSFEGCYFNINGDGYGGGLVFSSSTSLSITNFRMTNCVVRLFNQPSNRYLFEGFNNGANSGNLIQHCLFYSTSNGFTITNNLNNFNFSDNIFQNFGYGSGIVNSSFSNNIFFNQAGTIPWGSNGNTSASNLLSTNPTMVDQTGVNNADNNPLLNFSLASGSPGIAQASDGKNIGLLYEAIGTQNWANCRYTLVPYFTAATLNTPAVIQGNNISITVTSKGN